MNDETNHFSPCSLSSLSISDSSTNLSDNIVEVMYTDKSINDVVIKKHIPKHFTFNDDDIFLSKFNKNKKYVIKTYNIDIQLKIPKFNNKN